MTKKKEPDRQTHAGQKSPSKLGATPIRSSASAIVDSSHYPDCHQGREYLQADQNRAAHARDNTAGAGLPEAAYSARELAAICRQMNASEPRDPHPVLCALAKLLQSPGSTAADALAFAVTARTIMPVAFTYVDDEDAVHLHCLTRLIERTVETLEKLAVVKADSFTVDGQTIN